VTSPKIDAYPVRTYVDPPQTWASRSRLSAFHFAAMTFEQSPPVRKIGAKP
jgi:hypothetical protein